MTWTVLAGLVAAVVLAVGVRSAVRDGARRRDAIRGTSTHDAELYGLPEVRGWVRVRVGATSLLVDEPDSHRRYDLAATGLTLLEQVGDWSRGGDRERRARGRDGRGHDVEIVGRQSTMLPLWDALHDRPLPGRPRPPVELPTRDALVGSVFVALAGLGGLLVAAVVTTATPVVGTVVEPGGDDTPCVVVWEDPRDGAPRRSGVDCTAAVGDTVPVWSLGGPSRGQVWDADTPAGLGAVAVLVALLGVVCHAWDRWSRRRRARRAARAPVVPSGPEPGSLLDLAPGVRFPRADEVTFTTARALLAEVARARARRVWTADEIEEHRHDVRALARLQRVETVLEHLTGRTLRRRAALARTAGGEPSQLLYVLDRDPGPAAEPDGATVAEVLLFDAQGAPLYRLTVTGSGVARAAPSGTAHVRGELREDAPVRCTLEDTEVGCLGGLGHLDPAEWLDDLRHQVREAPDDDPR